MLVASRGRQRRELPVHLGGGGTLTINSSTGSPPRDHREAPLGDQRRRADKVFYQKTLAHPVRRLPRCGDGVRTECFTVKLASGDHIVKVPLSADPRVTRG